MTISKRKKNKAMAPDKIKAAEKFLSMDFETIYASLTREEQQQFWRKVIDKIIFDPETRDFSIIFL